MVAPTGLVIGRFDPPHLGHSFLIERARALATELRDADGPWQDEADRLASGSELSA